MIYVNGAIPGVIRSIAHRAARVRPLLDVVALAVDDRPVSR
jgi:hypothetical protein